MLRDEAEAYAQRLFISTVETEGYRYDGMVHGFLRMAGVVERSNNAIDEICESLTAALDAFQARVIGAGRTSDAEALGELRVQVEALEEVERGV